MVNRGVLIGHHVSVGDFVTLSPGANVASSCRIGRASYLGMGTVVTNERVVGPGSMLCAGAVLTKDLPERVKAAGAPARVIQRDFDIE